MELNIPLFNGFSLRITESPTQQGKYPTAILQKGLRLFFNEIDLAEEGVGFGMPIIKLGQKTLFPGRIKLSYKKNETLWEIAAHYKLNLEERVGKKGKKTVNTIFIYKIQNSLAAIYRRIPSTRQILTIMSNSIRWMFQWETQYSESNHDFDVTITYIIDTLTGTINIGVNSGKACKDSVTEIILMNEQGANYFDYYQDMKGEKLEGKEISAWEEVSADCAEFLCRIYQVAFSLKQIKGAKLFKGRELIGNRLAWSGFGYSIPTSSVQFSYEIKIENQK